MMGSMSRGWAYLGACACVIAGCSPARDVELASASSAPSHAPDVNDVLSTYTSLKQMGNGLTSVGPSAFATCDGSSSRMSGADVQAAWGPHANTYIRVFMSVEAERAIANGTAYPVGSIVVKQKEVMRSTHPDVPNEFAGVGGMIKRAPGYDPANGDWEYFYQTPDKRLSAGKIESCIACHRGAAATDRVFGSWDREARGKKTSSPSVDSVLAHYMRYHRETPQSVRIDAAMFYDCRPAPKAQVEAARRRLGPHDAGMVDVYTNELAHDAVLKSTRPFPEGSAIVKEKDAWDPNRGYSHSDQWALAGMIKRAPGYNPANGDWEYFYFAPPQPVERGVLQSCIACHRGGAHNDYVLGTWGGAAKEEPPVLPPKPER